MQVGKTPSGQPRETSSGAAMRHPGTFQETFRMAAKRHPAGTHGSRLHFRDFDMDRAPRAGYTNI